MQGALSELPLGVVLPVVLGAIDAARGNIHAVIQNATIARREPAVVAGTHGAHLAMHAALLPFKASPLMEVELTFAKAVGNASLLVELALDERRFLCSRRRGLGDCHGRRCNQSRHQD